MPNQKLIKKFDKNAAEVVKVQIQDYQGSEYVDLRVWTNSSHDDSGEERPTRKGITLNTELLPDLIEALRSAQSVIEGK
ncbi:MAG: transcriptional coactivator p15/PC4 family protein [Deltaproteobacteria bacterium]|nr:transcriptional coactivator p15/PC4 family protein [Deltaproteobacteria bacterium]